MSTKWVYLFEEVADAEKYTGSWEGVRSLLGGKGANLGEMTRIGVPVPPGLTVTTEACNAYLENNNQFPEGMWEQELDAMKAVEKSTGKKGFWVEELNRLSRTDARIGPHLPEKQNGSSPKKRSVLFSAAGHLRVGELSNQSLKNAAIYSFTRCNTRVLNSRPTLSIRVRPQISRLFLR